MKRAAAVAVTLAIAIGAAVLSAQAGTQINRAMKLEPGGRFVLETFAGNVNISGSDKSGADVAITSDQDIDRDIDVNFAENPGDAEVHARWRGPWSIFGAGFLGLHLRFDVRVPKNTQVVIRTSGGSIKAFALGGDTELRTSGGTIEASQLTGNLRTNSSGGNIRVQVIHGDANVWTSGGGIEADAIDGALRAYTSGGWIRINGVGGRVDARTSGGSIDAAFNKGDSQGGELSTSGGSITVKLDPAANLDIDAATSGGGVRSDLPLRTSGTFSHNRLHGTLGSGGAVLRMRTSGGGIRISAL